MHATDDVCDCNVSLALASDSDLPMYTLVNAMHKPSMAVEMYARVQQAPGASGALQRQACAGSFINQAGH